ncbi:MAG: hypothetical protein FWF15_03795 [Oscillospiraceae bacterium]|nr:hypothetical protein [Oscillospiraceae bacterium]
MRTINTISGRKISAQEVKKILIHEHLLIDMTHEAVRPTDETALELFYSDVTSEHIEMLRKNPYVIRSNLVLDDVQIAVAELKQSGVDLLVDCTSIGLGRDIEKLRYISEAANVQVVAGCGLFVHDSLPPQYANWPIEKIADWMLGEINNGDIGIIGEIGTSEIIYPIEERSLHAAAIVHKESGLPVMLHTYPWSDAGLHAAQLLLSDGVPPEKICVCHVDVTFNEDLMLDLLKLGVYIEFDDFGKEFEFEPQEGAFAGGSFEKDQTRVEMLAKLCNVGYAKQILLANDVCLKSLLRAYGGNGYNHLFENIVPMMREAGVDEKTLLHENLVRYLFL